MAPCAAENTLSQLVAGQLDAREVALIEAHLDSCSTCFRLLAQVARTSFAGGATPGGMAALEDDDVPVQIEEYLLVRRIGRGAMGQVFQALDTRLDRAVAIKLMAVEHRAELRERFLVEARALARLSHPNVVTIHRVGAIGERPYIVYELVRGTSLDAIVKPVPWRLALDLAIGLARGLTAAHRAGVLHRDIKPANAMLSHEGSVKLLDFGLAKLVESQAELAASPVQPVPSGAVRESPPTLTSTGALLGTPLYMAPEAWRGEAPSESMDVYSLGALVYELCSGNRAHGGRTIDEIREASLTRSVAPLARSVPGVDLRFAAAVDRCLEREPDARWPSAEALGAAFEAATIVPTPAVLPAPRRRVGRAWIVAAGLLLAVGSTITWALREHGSSAASDILHVVVRTSGPGKETIDGVTYDAQGNMYLVGHATSGFELGGHTVASPQPGRSFGYVARLGRDRRVLWMRTLVSTDEVHATAVVLDGAGRVAVSGSYAGAMHDARVPARGSLWDCFVATFDAETGEPGWVRVCGASQSAGRNLAVDRRGNLYVSGELDGQASFGSDRLLGVPLGRAGAPRGSAAPFVASFTRAGVLRWAWTPSGGSGATAKALRVAGDGVYVGGSMIGDVTFAEPSQVSTGGRDGFVARLDADSGRVVWSHRLGSTGDAETLAVDVSSDGHTVAAGGFYTRTMDLGAGEIHTASSGRDAWLATLDAATGATRTVRLPESTGEDDLVRALAFTDDGRLVATGRFDGVLSVDDRSIQSHGRPDVFVLALDAQGRLLRLLGWGGELIDRPGDLRVDDDLLTVTGHFSPVLKQGSSVATLAGGLDGWVAQVRLRAFLTPE